MFDAFFDSAFGFLLNWPPLLAIALVSFVISLLITLIYKWTTNKQAMAVNMQYMAKSMKSTFITFIPILLIFGWMSANFAFEPLMPNQEFTLAATLQKEIAGNVSVTVPEGLEVVGDSTKQIENGMATFTLKGSEGDYFVTLASNGQEVDKKRSEEHTSELQSPPDL